VLPVQLLVGDSNCMHNKSNLCSPQGCGMCQSPPDANGGIAGLQYACACKAQCEQLLDDFGAIPIGYGTLAGGGKCLGHWVWRN
jgi:hypothetical protein